MICTDGQFCKHERQRHRMLVELEGEALVEAVEAERAAIERGTVMLGLAQRMRESLTDVVQLPRDETAH